MESFETIAQTTQNLVLEILHVNREVLREDIDLFTLNMDSINAIRLILALQDTFGVAFDSSEVSFDNFRTVGKIAELIARKKRENWLFA